MADQNDQTNDVQPNAGDAVAPEPQDSTGFGMFPEVLSSIEEPEPIVTMNTEMPNPNDVVPGANQAEPSAENPAPEANSYTIKHNGQEVELNLSEDELKEYLQKGYDYTKKTTDLSQQRQEFGEQVQQFSSLQNVLRDPSNADLLDLIEARARGERVPKYQQNNQNQTQTPQNTDPYEDLRLNPDEYEPQLVNTVNKLLDEHRQVSSELEQQKVNQSRQRAMEVGETFNNEFKNEFGRDMSQEEIGSMINTLVNNGLDLTNIESYRMASNHLFGEQRMQNRINAEIEKLRKDHNNGVVSRSPSSGVKPQPRSQTETPQFKGNNAHSDAQNFILKKYGLA